MGSITFTATADDEIIEKAREYAAFLNTSLNALACDWLRGLAAKPARNKKVSCLTPELIEALNDAKGNSNGWKWNREEIHRECIL